MSSASIARQTFELANDVVELDAHSDSIFVYDDLEQAKIRNEAPWKKDPNFFQRVRISSAALIKMMIHTRAGGIYEVMGTMTGKVDVQTRTIYIMDAFALPVQGTETRVNAGDEAYEFMVEWQESSKRVGRLENAIGWYHSHPGYGCWLSGIDVNTQMTNQQYQDPFVAVVIDPNRTISAGRVDIGAFRTYPPDYKPSVDGPSSEYQSIPLNKIEDFGVHADRYYPLKVEHFRSSLDSQLLDMLWNKYWVSTLAQSPVVVNRAFAVGQIKDVAEKLKRTEASVVRRAGGLSSSMGALGPVMASSSAGGGNSGSIGSPTHLNGSATGRTYPKNDTDESASRKERAQMLLSELRKREQEAPLAKAAQDGHKISLDAHNGLISQILKDSLFNRGNSNACLPSSSSPSSS
ncbi:hypothetical protein IEQ34_025209 [Dendrobium chrysotoxum]|uniref:MPN domain-containing protein n=1 Tax=Dendrobium chrysotoxum TaxID=161865 RepID=A0AAV7FRQ2_DENCH|nr:hypothetical protein IEQ34_025209 [Dendrobium chrysotoxum]